MVPGRVRIKVADKYLREYWGVKRGQVRRVTRVEKGKRGGVWIECVILYPCNITGQKTSIYLKPNEYQ